MLKVEKAVFHIKMEMLHNRALIDMNCSLKFGDYIIFKDVLGYVVQIRELGLNKCYVIRSYTGDIEEHITVLYWRLNSDQIAIVEPFFCYKLEREKIENRKRLYHGFRGFRILRGTKNVI